jgi:hypothetical protein
MIEIDIITYGEPKSAWGSAVDLAMMAEPTNLVKCFGIRTVASTF